MTQEPDDAKRLAYKGWLTAAGIPLSPHARLTMATKRAPLGVRILLSCAARFTRLKASIWANPEGSSAPSKPPDATEFPRVDF